MLVFFRAFTAIFVAEIKAGHEFYPPQRESAGQEKLQVSLCLLRSRITVQDYLRDAMHRRHTHISKADADLLLGRDVVRWVRINRNMEVLQWVPDAHKFKFSVRGLSCQVGAPIAMAVEELVLAVTEGRRVPYRKWAWALTLLRQVQTRPPRSSRRGIPKHLAMKCKFTERIMVYP